MEEDRPDERPEGLTREGALRTQPQGELYEDDQDNDQDNDQDQEQLMEEDNEGELEGEGEGVDAAGTSQLSSAVAVAVTAISGAAAVSAPVSVSVRSEGGDMPEQKDVGGVKGEEEQGVIVMDVEAVD